MTSERLSRDVALMLTAGIWASRSTCWRLKVGAVFSREGRILAQGYNGAPAGLPHCDYPHEPEDCSAVHAEQNAVAWSARNGVRLDGSELHVTDAPCLGCARSLINAGVVRVMFARKYRLREGIELLDEAGVEVLLLPKLPDIVIP